MSQEVSKTSVTSDLLQSFQILSELGVQGVRDQLSPVAVSDISLSVQEPFGNVIVYNTKNGKKLKNQGRERLFKLAKNERAPLYSLFRFKAILVCYCTYQWA